MDSSGWLAFFADEPNAQHFALPLEKTDQLLVPSITLTEVFKRILQQAAEAAALEAVAQMRRGRVVELDARIAVEAATLGHAHGLPLANSIIYATGRLHRALIWTQDGDFESLEGVKYFRK
ncbi:MAG: type II toxin-antitoxin system VapC family toxin [Xanthomonadales bacterium]|nr:type II toxin-antitoxin system VapC family toxin [Xanthomonadales bacterium]